MPVKVAVIGAGYLGRHHARIYSELEGAELVGVVDIDSERAGEIAARYGARSFRDYHDALDQADALSIVVPTTSHYAVALDCLRAGKDILIEKPITTTVEEAMRLIDEADEDGRILQVGHLERYNPGVLALRRLVEKPRFLEAVRVSPYLKRGDDVDITLDLMIHDIDIVLSFVSAPISSMHAVGLSLVTDTIDETKAWLEFADGTVALLTASRVAREKERRLRIYQGSGCLELDYQKTEVRRYAAVSASPGGFADGSPIETIMPEPVEPLKRELSDFVRCVALRQRPPVSGVEGRAALQVALDITNMMRRRD